MGLIDTIKNKLPFGGEPESNLTVSDFEDTDEGNEGDNEQDSSENKSEEEQEGEGSGESGEDNSEESEEEQEGEGSGESGEDNSEEEQEGEGSGESGEDNSEEEQEGEDGQNEGGSGESSEKENPTNLSEEELEDLKKEMDEDSSERDMSDWYDTTSDYQSPTNFVEDHYNNLQQERAEPETDIEKRVEDRDSRISNSYVRCSHERVLDRYKDRFENDIKEAFRKIKTREAPKPAEYGQRINMRGVIRRRSGDPTEERLYLEMDQSEVGDRCITVVVDSSGSMSELEIKLALMALSEACEQIGDRFVATHYCTPNTRSQRKHECVTELISSPTESFEPKHLDSFGVGGYTPTASGIEDGRALSDITPNSEDVIIVITDGVANIDLDGKKHSDSVNSNAMNESQMQVNAAINEGKRVIGIGVGDALDDKSMQKIFGNNYIRTDMNGISDAVVEIYRQQMKSIN